MMAMGPWSLRLSRARVSVERHSQGILGLDTEPSTGGQSEEGAARSLTRLCYRLFLIQPGQCHCPRRLAEVCVHWFPECRNDGHTLSVLNSTNG